MASLSCSGPPPALEIGPIDYTAEELSTLDADQRDPLPRLAAFGLAVAEGALDEITAPYIHRDIRSLMIQRLALELAADLEGVDDASLRRRYRRDPRHELVVRHLVILSERWRPDAHRDSARAVAAEALERARAGEPFDELAAEYSDEPGAEARGGLLEPGREGSWVPEFWEAASSLTEGGISDVVETEYGFHVIKLDERRQVPFEEVRELVLEDAMSLPRALGAAGAWASRPLAVAIVDTAAVDAWRSEEVASAPLVRWPDSLAIPALEADALTTYLRTLPTAGRPRRPMSRTEALDLVSSAARTHVMYSEAERRGIEPSRSQRAAIRDRWMRRVEGWAEAVGYRAGMSTDTVAQQALQLAGSVRQSVVLARSALQELEPLLLDAYPVRRAAGAAATGE